MTALHDELELRLQNFEMIPFLKPNFSCTIKTLTVNPNIEVTKNTRLNKV